MQFSMRFDFRNPGFAGTTMADRYAAAIEMAEWADRLGCASIVISEHHGVDDGYIPSPALMIAAMAVRTRNVRFAIGALIAPFHDPLRIAEDLCVLDNITKGRVDVIVAGGYVQEEFDMFDVPLKERPRRVTEVVKTMKAAFSGEPFEYRGRTVRVTPTPIRPGGPAVLLGASSEPAARRAARIADGLVPSVPQLWEYYCDELAKLGRPHPGPCPVGESTAIVLAEDPDAAWAKLGQYFLYENNAYGAWRAQGNGSGPYETVADVAELRTTGRYNVSRPADLIQELNEAANPIVLFHPLCGGTPPDLAWENLHLFEHKVLPYLK